VAEELVKEEISSTLYMLYILSKSFITGSQPSFHFNGGDIYRLSGRWEDDARYFTLDDGTKQPQNKTGKLVFGAGPSASGKTTLSKKLLESGEYGEKSFLTIDGGEYRDRSFSYGWIRDSVISAGYVGISDLVISGLLQMLSIFDSDIVKNTVIDYLRSLNRKFNIFVPETFSGGKWKGVNILRGRFFELDIVKTFRDLTGDDEYDVFFIYQHKCAAECPFKATKYACKGCQESGRERQAREGKKYSSQSYDASMKNGLQILCSAPGKKFIVHNSGGRADGKPLLFKIDSNNTIIEVHDFSDDVNNIYKLNNERCPGKKSLLTTVQEKVKSSILNESPPLSPPTATATASPLPASATARQVKAPATQFISNIKNKISTIGLENGLTLSQQKQKFINNYTTEKINTFSEELQKITTKQQLTNFLNKKLIPSPPPVPLPTSTASPLSD